MAVQDGTAKPPGRGRIGGLDLLKGLVMLVMGMLHAAYFFNAMLLEKLVRPLDPYVFGGFLLAFGLGNGLSRRKKRVRVLLDLLAAALVAGVVAYACSLRVLGTPLNEIGAMTLTRLEDSLLLRNRLDFADFLLPYIFHFACLLAVQRLLLDLRTSLMAAAFLGIGFFLLGMALDRTGLPSAPALVHGFRVFQSAPVFWGDSQSGRS